MAFGTAAITNLYTALNASFNAAFQGAETWFTKLAMTIPASTGTIDYKAIIDFPGIREWLGDRQARSISPINMTLTAKDWEGTIFIKKNDIDDDQLGLYGPMVQQLAIEAKQHPNELIAALITNGGTGTAYDGIAFFSAASHKIGDGSTLYGNFDSGASTAWYLFDTSRPVKPFIFQLRQNFQQTAMDAPQDEVVFNRKTYRYGVDARYEAGYLFPQLAYKSTQVLNKTYLAAAIAAMAAYTNADGRPLRVRPNILAVPPSLEMTARDLVYGDYYLGSLATGGTADYVGGAMTNVWKGALELMVIPELI